MDRRTVLITAGAAAAAGVVAACSPAGSDAATASPSVPGGGGGDGTAAAPSNASGSAGALTVGDIPVGGGVVLPEAAVVVTQPEQGTVKAFSAICTHEGCLVSQVVQDEIICPCHGARFSAVDGSVLQGPAEQPLGEQPVALDGDRIVVG